MEQQSQNYWQSGFQREGQPSSQPTSDERTLAILCHVLSIFFWIFPALVIYLVKKDESAWVAAHAREALNFQITWTLIAIALAVSIIGLILMGVPIVITILSIVATIKASENKLYRYPLTWRIIK